MPPEIVGFAAVRSEYDGLITALILPPGHGQISRCTLLPQDIPAASPAYARDLLEGLLGVTLPADLPCPLLVAPLLATLDVVFDAQPAIWTLGEMSVDHLCVFALRHPETLDGEAAQD